MNPIAMSILDQARTRISVSVGRSVRYRVYGHAKWSVWGISTSPAWLWDLMWGLFWDSGMEDE